MFEEICLTCGKHLTLDGPYCSDECQRHDTMSPSSASSSTYSSPHLQGYAAGPEVPPLSLPPTSSRHRYSMSSSSASSTTWSNSEEEDSAGLSSDNSAHEDFADEIPKPSSGAFHAAFNPLMYYARRPSGTNHRSLVPQLYPSRLSSSSASSNGMHRRSPPMIEDDSDLFSDVAYSEEENTHMKVSSTAPHSRAAMPIRRSRKPHAESNKTISASASSKRTKNRGSLPAYFSLLQMGSPSKATTSVTITSSSFHPSTSTTSVRESPLSKASPPTPKIPQSCLMTGTATITSRGRTTFASNLPTGNTSLSRCPRRDSSSSPSMSPEVRSNSVLPPRLRLNSKSSVVSSRTATKRSSVNSSSDLMSSQILLASRGRAPARRRNSSSPPSHALIDEADILKRDSRTASPPRTRGRAKAEELPGGSAEAPGFGYGRSGLLDRAQRRTSSRRQEI